MQGNKYPNTLEVMNADVYIFIELHLFFMYLMIFICVPIYAHIYIYIYISFFSTQTDGDSNDSMAPFRYSFLYGNRDMYAEARLFFHPNCYHPGK